MVATANEDTALRMIYNRMHTVWCPNPHDDLSDCEWLSYGLFQTDPELSDLMLGFPLGLS